MNLLRKGAEADIYRTDSTIIKERIPKSYRAKDLDDKLRKERTRAEAKLMARAGKIIDVPRIIRQDKFSIEMEYISGPRIKDILSKKNFHKICTELSHSIAAMHKAEIIHGDLTTSNLLMQQPSKASSKRKRNEMMYSKGKIYFIDFGLGFFSKMPEDMAVDLHTLFEAFHSTHSDIADEAIALVLSEYEIAGGKVNVIERIEKLKSRGRYVKRAKPL